MDARGWLVLLTAGGFLITVVGLVAAWLGARREYSKAQARIDMMETLSAQEIAEHARQNDSAKAGGPRETAEQTAARHSRWEEEYRCHEIVRVSYTNLPFVAAYESRRLLGLVLSSTRRDFLVAAIGLLVSTAASIGSLFLTT